MLRSFGVVGALAAAALALVIGVLAFNSHSNSQKAPVIGGPGPPGVASHAATANYPTGPGAPPLVIGKGAVQASSESSGGPVYPAVGESTGTVLGGQSYVPAPVTRPGCGGGLLGAVFGLLGGLLGGC